MQHIHINFSVSDPFHKGKIRDSIACMHLYQFQIVSLLLELNEG